MTETDHDGWFRTARDYPEGQHLVGLGSDRHAGWRAPLAHVRGSYRLGVPERRVSSGPRYPLVWPSGSASSLAGQRMRMIPSLGDAQPMASVFGVVTSRAGQTWVQFPPLTDRLEHSGPWTLELNEQVEHSFVQGRVQSVDTSLHAPVELEKIDAAELEILITDQEGQVASGTEVTLTERATGRTLQRTPSIGLLKLHGLRPGPYLLEVRGHGFYGSRLEFELAPGANLELPVALEPALGDGEVQVVIESASGEYHGRTSVLLSPIALEESGLDWEARSMPVLWREEGGAWYGSCAFEGLPSGEYELTAQGGQFHCWAPGARRVRPGADRTVLQLLDQGDESDLVLRVFDGETGGWVEEYVLELTGSGCGKQFSSTRRVQQARANRDDAALTTVPPSVQVRWCVSVDGYERRCGDMESFSSARLVDGRRVRVADVHLARSEPSETAGVNRRND